MSSGVVVREAQAADADAWEGFVADHPEATFFHRFGWKTVLEKAFGHRCSFLVAERDGQLVGLLPLAQVRSLLFGNKLSSLPFAVYGGILAADEVASEALRGEACGLADRLKVDALELRNSQKSDSGWPTKELYFTFRKPIDADNDVNMKAIPNKQRAMVRKGIKAGLSSEETDDTRRLYRVYSESVRNLGTPVFARKYLDILRQVFGRDCRILMICEGEDDVAGVMSFYFKGEVLPYYGGSIARARAIKGCNDFMYWELLRRSADEGLCSFDFGRSKLDTGPFRFKKNWGFTPQPLPYEYYLARATAVPNVSPTNPKYSAMISVWSRLPLPVANAMGPVLARSLG